MRRNRIPLIYIKNCLRAWCPQVIAMLLTLSTVLVTAQTLPLDSLLNGIKTMPDDNKKINTLLQLAKRYQDAPPQLTELKNLASCYSTIGGIYTHIGNYEKALEYHIKALRIAEAIVDKNKICESYISMGTIFFEQKKFKECIAYMNKALAVEGEHTAKRNLAYIYNNLGIAYNSLNDPQQSLPYQLEALKLNQELGDDYGTATCYNNISGVYNALHKPGEALAYCLKSIALSEKLHYKVGLTYSYIIAGDYFGKQKDTKTAETYYLKALTTAREINYKKEVCEAYEHLSFLSEEMKDYGKALEYHKLYAQLKDSILNEESLKQSSELNIRYETEKKEKEILLLTKDQELKDKTLKQQRILRFGLIIGLGLLLALSFVLYNRYRFKQKANLKLTKTQDELYKLIEQKEKLTSILAHDLKTPLRFMTTVSTYLNKNMGIPDRAKLERLSAELSTAAKNTYAFADELLTWLSIQQQNFATVNAEVSMNSLVNELQVFFQDIAKAQQTEIKIDASPAVFIETDKRLLKIILRNLLDNAIKHTNQGEVVITVYPLNSETVELCIRDTGSGMTTEQLEMLDLENTYGFQFEIKNKLGFQIIKDLSTLLSIKLEITSEVNVGTTVMIQLPVKQKKQTE
jgi:two-component system sensor histidine kinase/response regulator